jgi:hypothetical protein
MAKQILNAGVTNNDKSGDTLRAGALKIKANFDEIYGALATDGLNISGGNLLKTGSYADLRNKPNFATIATTGSFDDLLDKPSLVTSTATPETLIGFEGQSAGQIAFDGNNLYVSVSAYDGETSIWKYIPWGGGGTTQGYNYAHNQDPTIDGGLSLDNDDPELATVAYVSVKDVNGNDIHPFYQYVFDNNLNFLLEIISATNPANRALFRVTGVQEMNVGGAEYYELNLDNITHTTGMTIGSGVWDLHFDFTGTANTGNVSFDDVKIIGSGTASGDGNGYATLELVPDNNLYANGQYLVIDPTAPSHIHIRAGGPQDQSNADLFLGGENNYVRVRDNQGIRLQNQYYTDQFWYYTDSNDFTTGTWYEENGNYYVEFTTTNQTMISKFWDFTNGGQNRLIINQNDNVEYGGSASNPSADVYKVQVLTAPPTSPTNLTSLEFQIFVTNTNYLQIENNDFRVDVQDDIRMFGRDIFRFVNYSIEEPIEITTDYDNQSWTWRFQPDGRLDFPDGGGLRVSNFVPSSSVGSLGNKAGMVVFDTTHLYYCVQDYDGTTNIWKRVAWSNDTW